jgi:hypothetical protein
MPKRLAVGIVLEVLESVGTWWMLLSLMMLDMNNDVTMERQATLPGQRTMKGQHMDGEQ